MLTFDSVYLSLPFHHWNPAKPTMQRPFSDLGMTAARPSAPSRQDSTGPAYTPAFPSDASPLSSPHPSRPGSRRQSFAHPFPSLSRRGSMASGPRPITKAEYSGPATPSLLSRAGSPTLPLGNDETKSSYDGSRRGSLAGLSGLGGLGGFSGMSALDEKRELKHGEFIGSVDCGTT